MLRGCRCQRRCLAFPTCAIAFEGHRGHLGIRKGGILEVQGRYPRENPTGPDRPPTRRISLAMAPAFPPKSNEKRRPPAQSPSRRGRNRSKQKELPKGAPLVLGSVTALWTTANLGIRPQEGELSVTARQKRLNCCVVVQNHRT